MLDKRMTRGEWLEVEQLVREVQGDMRREAAEQGREMFEYRQEQQRLGNLLTWKPGDFQNWDIERLASLVYSNIGTPSEAEPDYMISLFPGGDQQRREFWEVWSTRKHELEIAPDWPEPARPLFRIKWPKQQSYTGTVVEMSLMTLGERLWHDRPAAKNRRKQSYQALKDFKKKLKRTKNERELKDLEQQAEHHQAVIYDPVVVEAQKVMQYCDEQIEYIQKIKDIYQQIHDDKFAYLDQPLERVKYVLRNLISRVGTKPPKKYFDNYTGHWPPVQLRDWEHLAELGYDFDVFENEELPEEYKRTPEEERDRVARYYGPEYIDD